MNSVATCKIDKNLNFDISLLYSVSESVQTHISRDQYSIYFLFVVPVTLKNNFHMNRMETFCKIYEKQTFGLFLLGPIQVKMDPKIRPLGAHILHACENSSSALIKLWKPLAKFDERLTFNLILVLFGVKKDQKYGLGPILYTHLKVPCYACETSFMVPY